MSHAVTQIQHKIAVRVAGISLDTVGYKEFGSPDMDLDNPESWVAWYCQALDNYERIKVDFDDYNVDMAGIQVHGNLKRASMEYWHQPELISETWQIQIWNNIDLPPTGKATVGGFPKGWQQSKTKLKGWWLAIRATNPDHDQEINHFIEWKTDSKPVIDMDTWKAAVRQRNIFNSLKT